MGKVVIGIDPSSKKIAAAIGVDGEHYELRSKGLAPYDLPMACFQSYAWVRNLVREFKEQGHKVYVFIEDPVIGRGGAYTTLRQARPNGAMQAGAVGGRATQVHGANNATWKKQVIGNGRAGKPEIKKWVRDCWPALFKMADGDQDLLDAAGILRYGEMIVARQEKIEALKSTEELESVRRRR